MTEDLATLPGGFAAVPPTPPPPPRSEEEPAADTRMRGVRTWTLVPVFDLGEGMERGLVREPRLAIIAAPPSEEGTPLRATWADDDDEEEEEEEDAATSISLATALEDVRR